MGLWNRVFGRRASGGDDPEREWGDTLRAAGMPEHVVEMELKFRRARAQAWSSDASIRAEDGSATGSELACSGCGRRMVKIATGAGRILLGPMDMEAGIGPAEECIECGRAFCPHCFPQERRCPCGLRQDAVRIAGGNVYRGSLRLIKVQFP